MPGSYHIPLLPDKTYHLFNRAVGNEKLFRSNDNYIYFLKKYAEHVSAICDTWSYCLLPNHFHLLIRVKDADAITDQYKLIKKRDPHEYDVLILSDFIMERFSNWMNGYTKAINKMYGRKGALFMDYSKRSLAETDSSFGNLIHYIHANPVHHGYVKNIDEWHYSSYKAIISNSQTKLLRNDLLSWFNGKDQFVQFHKQPIYCRPNGFIDLD